MPDAIRGKSIVLRPIAVADTDMIVRWRNSPRVRENLFDQRLITREDHLAWLDKYIHSGECVQYVILENGMKEIGTAFLKGVKAPDRAMEFGIFIGEPRGLGKGHGKSATKALVRHAFHDLQAAKVWLEVMAQNTRAISIYSSLGFLTTGRYAKETSEGEPVAVLRMEIREWHDQ